MRASKISCNIMIAMKAMFVELQFVADFEKGVSPYSLTIVTNVQI